MRGGRSSSRRRMRPALLLAAIFALLAAPALAAEPLKLGFGMALTGGLAGNGKAALLALQMWAEDVNAKGGLLGRKVELVYYDDQSSPSTVPALYTKLLDVDKVDLVLSGYATTQIAAAMPIVMQHEMAFITLFGIGINDQFHYPNFFGIQPVGPDSAAEVSRGFFALAAAQSPKPATLAIASADAEYGKAAAEGARKNAAAAGLKIVYDKSYPPSTVDYSPIVRAIQAAEPDVVLIASYPPDTVGIIRAAHELGLKTKLFGGAMVGLQFTALAAQLGELLNGIVDFDYYVPAPTMNFPGIEDFLKRYQARAKAAGVDPLGFYLPPFTYAEGQILADAVEATKGLDQKKLGDYIHAHSFQTVVGEVAFAPGGEWAKPRVLAVQYRGIKGNDVEQFAKVGTRVVLYPPEYKSGELAYPYTDAQH